LGYRAARAALKAGRPYVISPHGGVNPPALRAKGLKKSLYMWGVQRPQLRGSAAVHCLTGYEADQVRKLGVQVPTRIIPNGVVLPPLSFDTQRSFLTQRHPELSGKRVLLFLGRLHRSKGLDLLVEAYCRLPAELHRESALVLVGPDEGYRGAIESLVAARGLEGNVVMTGPLFGEEKTAALYGADLFVMPSLSEGFSMAVLEALAHSLPVLITTECHFPEVETNGAGVIVPTDPTEMSQAMLTLLTGPDQRKTMGQAGRRLVEREFSWETCVDELMELYSDSISGRPGELGREGLV
jgi:glycosyltransferase involved in cell wall biosynthesis